MIKWIITFLLIAIVAGILGFTNIARGIASVAKIIFYVFVGLLILSVVPGITPFKREK